MKHAGGFSEPPKRASEIFPELPPTTPPGGVATQSVRAKVPSLADRAQLKHVRFTTTGFADMHEHGDLVPSFLRARKTCFIDGLGWELPCTEGMEFDQYDTPECRWVIMHEYGEILGGLRLMPTTSRCAIYTYMLRDAQLGLLEKIPRDVLFSEAPVSPTVWEGTRLFIVDNAGSKRRHALQLALFEHMLRSAEHMGAQHVLGFVPDGWSRWTKRLGLSGTPVGPKVTIDGVVSQAAVMRVQTALSRFAKVV
ncbi:N-acyl-L-homoserine lactone synthetase [Lutimaribacter pacificus]|uniref:Acyl-homoserine-lactone synthase n=2 Tax=Lutimaribacter pacificus TaxID=391948 RepID=A0A1H0HPY3_9RHOB|nr:acyl-homoserine-lactone synthase [Lutimaribacter pacificus]SDO21178.1 N-acyl-L-homoserine lactone synthetase [Lutimaribacter pacificus]SHK32848.1 N-acyl-L-homoserine lactone synthetase [Lutimaribacter pacificus]